MGYCDPPVACADYVGDMNIKVRIDLNSGVVIGYQVNSNPWVLFEPTGAQQSE